MEVIADIDTIIEVLPEDELSISISPDEYELVDNRTPFRFQVKDRLMDGQFFYGLYGPVVSGPERYNNLICNIFVRLDGTDWTKESVSQANFKVGTSIATRNHHHDFKHPDGTVVSGYPIISRFAAIRVIPSS